MHRKSLPSGQARSGAATAPRPCGRAAPSPEDGTAGCATPRRARRPAAHRRRGAECPDRGEPAGRQRQDHAGRHEPGDPGRAGRRPAAGTPSARRTVERPAATARARPATRRARSQQSHRPRLAASPAARRTSGVVRWSTNRRSASAVSVRCTPGDGEHLLGDPPEVVGVAGGHLDQQVGHARQAGHLEHLGDAGQRVADVGQAALHHGHRDVGGRAGSRAPPGAPAGRRGRAPRRSPGG